MQKDTGLVLDEAKILNKTILLTNTAAREAAQGYDKAYIFENSEERNIPRYKNGNIKQT